MKLFLSTCLISVDTLSIFSLMPSLQKPKQILFDLFRNALANTISQYFFVMWFLSIIFIQTHAASSAPLSYYDYSPPLIEGERITFIKGFAVDTDPSAVFVSSYTVTLKRLQNPTPGSYMVAIGFKILEINVATYPYAVSYLIAVTTQTSTSFVCEAYASDQLYIKRYQVTYVAISRSIGNIYIFNQLKSVNTALVSPAYMDFNFTDPSIKVTGRTYYTFVSIYHLFFAYQAGIVTPWVYIVVAPYNATSYFTRILSHGMFIYQFGVQGFLIDSILINNVKAKNVLLIQYYYHPGPISYFAAPIYSYPGVKITTSNIFFGLNFFHSHLNKVGYQLNVTNSQIYLYKQVTAPYIAVYLMVFFRNHCPDPYTYDQTISGCRLCMFYCQSCDGPQCFQCVKNFTLSADSLACQCTNQLVSGICFQFNQSSMKGCVSAQVNLDKITCLFCSIHQNLILINNECHCIQGYEFDSNKNCIETCGDGKLFYLPCDDGNLENGDGCTDKCQIQSGFSCTKIGPLTCNYMMPVVYELSTILKNKNNSAVFKFKPRDYLLFPIKLDYLIDQNGLNRFNIKTLVNGTQKQLDSTLMSVQNNEISLLVNYNFTIECSNSQLNLDLSETKYIPESSQLKFNSCGDNQPLIISENAEMFQKTEYTYIAVGALVLVLLFVGLCTPKYIGVEAITTLQLIYYSCFLVTDINKFPVGFTTFASFKYSNGFNDLFKYTSISLQRNYEKKVVWMTLHKSIIENYNLSFLLLLGSFILMLIAFIYRLNAQQSFEQRSSKYSNAELQAIHQKIRTALKINNSSFNLFNQICIWSILQVIAALQIQFLVNNQYVNVIEEGFFFKSGSILVLTSSFIIGMVGVNNFKNVLLSNVTWGKIWTKLHQLRYRQLNFLYLVVMGLLILVLNQKMIFSVVPISAVVLLIHIAYMVALYIIAPYKTCLNIHKYGLFICQIVYLIFLVVINVINFSSRLSEKVSLGIIGFVLVGCTAIIVFTIIRLYYEYRYGPELQKKIQKERQMERKFRLRKQESEMKRRMRSMENRFRQNLNQNQVSRLQNKYLIENQIREDLMKQEIDFLNTRPNLTEQKKDVYYFEQYHAKPLDWLKANNLQEYQKRIAELESQNQEEKQKKNQKLMDPEYKQLTKRLRKQFFNLNKSDKSQQYFKLKY